MDTFVCSSWYYLRYPDSKNIDEPFSKNSNNWLPVDYYIGGSEHATMHLLYARFITKCLRDLGYVSFDEPFINLFHQGTITKDGNKMSKSKGNTVSPDSFIENYGSDTFRCYLMFMGPFEEGGDWNDKGIKGINRFLNRSYRLIQKSNSSMSPEDEYVCNHTVDYITKNMYDMKFNTCISKLMEFVNHFYDKGITEEYKDVFVQILSPFAPHLGEEMWSVILKKNKSVFNEKWPQVVQSKLKKSIFKIAVQINGKVRTVLELNDTISKEDALLEAKKNQNIEKHLKDKEIKKEIYIPGKIINFVVY